MKEKSSFVLYHDIRTPLELLNDEDRGKLFMAILNYSEFGEVPEFNGALGMAFAFIRTALDRDTAAWEAKRTARAEAGRKGGKQNQANQAMLKFASDTRDHARPGAKRSSQGERSKELAGIFNETIRACGHSGAAGRTGGGNEAWIRKESHGG